MLTYGDERERNITDASDISPLFTGGKENYIKSITCICTPNNGSTLYKIADDYNLVHTLGRLTDLAMGLLGRTPLHGRFFDYQLEQFGLTPLRGEKKPDKIITAMNRVRDGEDYVLSDLSLEGACELNKLIEISENIYYFSFPANGCVGDNHSPENMSFPLLKIFSNTLVNLELPDAEFGIAFDESWKDNDGLVNTVSARNPFDEPAKDYDGDIKPGIWNVMPVLACDHGAATGLLANKKKIKVFYLNLARMLMKLETE